MQLFDNGFLDLPPQIPGLIKEKLQHVPITSARYLFIVIVTINYYVTLHFSYVEGQMDDESKVTLTIELALEEPLMKELGNNR